MKAEMETTAGRWAYVCCECFIQLEGSGVYVSRNNVCMACGNTNIRFNHILEHDGRQISVGIECARILVVAEDRKLPRLAENEVKRKERWRIVYQKPGRCTADAVDLEQRGKL